MHGERGRLVGDESPPPHRVLEALERRSGTRVPRADRRRLGGRCHEQATEERDGMAARGGSHRDAYRVSARRERDAPVSGGSASLATPTTPVLPTAADVKTAPDR